MPLNDAPSCASPNISCARAAAALRASSGLAHRHLQVFPLLLVVFVCRAAVPVHAQTGSDATQPLRAASDAFEQGHYDEAARLGEQARETQERSDGPDAPGLVPALLLSSRAYRYGGAYAKALPLAQHALDIQQRVFGKEAAQTADSLTELAEVYRALGRYPEALRLAQQALDIRERVGAPKAATAEALHTLGEVQSDMGKFAEALPLAQQALALREQAPDPDRAAIAESHNDLGVLYARMGNHLHAREEYDQALKIRMNVLGSSHPLTAETENNLAAFCWSVGNSKQAVEYCTQALGIQEPDKCKQTLAAEAIEHCRRAVAIKEKALGPENPLTAKALNNLAALYMAMGQPEQYPKALEPLHRACQIWDKELPEHPDTATCHYNIAWLHWLLGDTASPPADFQRALQIRKQVLGADHPDTARSLNTLAVFYQSVREYKRALAAYQDGLAAGDAVLINVLADPSKTEAEKLRFAEQNQAYYFAALSLIHQYLNADPQAVRFGLDLVLRHKGMIVDAHSLAQETVVARLRGEALQAWKDLTRRRAELQQLWDGGPGTRSAEEYRREVTALQESIARAERVLSQQSGRIAEELRQRQVTADALATHLHPDGALVEFVRLPDWDGKRLAWSAWHYLAFVLTPDNHIALVDLGEADPIDKKVGTVLAAINKVGSGRETAAYVARTDAALAELYGMILRPLESAIGPARRLIVSPDGELNKVPFAGLRTPQGHYLIEERVVSYVTSGRDLMRDKTGTAPTVGLLLAANPAFDDKTAVASADGPARATRGRSLNVIFPQLPGTAEEAQIITPLVSGTPKVLLGKDATKPAVLKAQSPRILHLATHGFFLKDLPQQPADPLDRSSRSGFRAADEMHNPMKLSGLALAGANVSDDGILRADEVTTMDLYSTDLVVLSACETALGAIEVGEGVYGLRRAFVLAGARNLLMTLWQVDDEVTRDLMGRFYRAYGQGTPVAQALQQAQLQTIADLRENKDGRQGGPFAPVYLWAPFMVQLSGQ